jgi:hypothetical protein
LDVEGLSQVVPSLDRVGRERRDAAVRRIDDQGRAIADMALRREDRVVRAADIRLRSARLRAIAEVIGAGQQLVQLGALRVGEELFVAVLSRPLERDLVLVAPDTLQVRFAPGGLRRRAALCRDRLAGRLGLARHSRRRQRDDSQRHPNAGPLQ